MHVDVKLTHPKGVAAESLSVTVQLICDPRDEDAVRQMASILRQVIPPEERDDFLYKLAARAAELGIDLQREG